MHQTPHSGAYCAYPHRPSLTERLNHPLHFPFRLWAESLTRRPVEFMVFATIALALGGASALWLAERGQSSGALHSWWDALWLAVTSVNENYGDVHPVTSLGRLITTLVATLGVLLIGSFTAAVTNYLMGDEQKRVLTALGELQARLERIEARLGQHEEEAQ